MRWAFPLALLVFLVPAMAQEIAVSVHVVPYISVVFSYNSVNFGMVPALTYGARPIPDYTTGVYNVSVTSSSNYDVYARHTGLPSSITLSMAVSHSPTSRGWFYGLSTSDQLIYSGSPGSRYEYHQYELSVEFAEAGYYTTTVIITYAPA